jgi:hypothetical protein
MPDWAGVEAETAAIINARPEEYDPAIRQNLAELLDLLKATNRPAPDISLGYWPTFRITWDLEGSKNLEIEVFDDRYEVYRFFDGKTDIWYEHRGPGDPISPAFLAELPQPT